MKLIVGLGNPGKNYKYTRHNVGFLILDNYLKDVKWQTNNNTLYYITNICGQKVCFLKPQTYMNLSGIAVREIVNYYKIAYEDILVIHDDLDIPTFSYKLKYNSSAAGHNGIKDIIKFLGSQEFSRLKIGIGHNQNIDTKDFVLSKLSKEEIDYLHNDIFKDIINYFIANDINMTMNKFNHNGDI